MVGNFLRALRKKYLRNKQGSSLGAYMGQKVSTGQLHQESPLGATGFALRAVLAPPRCLLASGQGTVTLAHNKRQEGEK